VLRSLRTKNKGQIASLWAHRRLIGILGMALPFLCWFAGAVFGKIGLQRSISYYYHTTARDLFVGVLFSVAAFLLTYKGRERIDILVNFPAGLAALGVAFFPCSEDGVLPGDPVGLFRTTARAAERVHMTSAILFFTLLAVNALCLFTLGYRKGKKTPQGKVRFVLYIACGSLILLTLLVLLGFFLAKSPLLKRSSLLFWLETVMLFAFGVSWLVKGRTIFRDRPARVALAA
jgi:drug/metabolite transporter (DMT)-like permease